MLKSYPLEPPPLLPPLDSAWDDQGRTLGSGRRGGWEGASAWFWDLPRLDRLAVLGPLELTDRRLVALEEPLFVWEVKGTGTLRLSCDVVFRALGLRYERAEDGSRLWLGAVDSTQELLVACYGGSVEVREEGERIRLEAVGQDRVRLAVVAAWDEADRERAVRALARKGVAGVAAQYVRHLGMIDALGASVTTPDPEVGARLDHLKRDLDGTLREFPDGHRGLLEPLGHGLPIIALGLREPVRDTLRGPLTDPDVLRLFAAYARWAGADEFVERHWPRVTAAMRDARRSPEPLDPIDAHFDAADELIPVAEALGDHETGTMLEEMIAGIEDLPRPVRPWQEPEEYIEMWGITPGALEGMVTLAPALPAGWPEMTFERLRIGATSLDARVKRRPGGIAVKLRITRGPSIVVVLVPRLDFIPTGILLEGEQLSGPSVRFTVDGEVEAVWTR